MKRPTKAVVLGAGLGTRMEPLSRVRPKALMPFWGRPMLDHTLDLLASWGVREVVTNIHHSPSAMLAYSATRSSGHPMINLSFEPEILGTGGALQRARWFLGEEPFWIMNADVVADLAPNAFLDAYRRLSPAAVLWTEPDRGPRTVEIDNCRITSFRSSRPGSCGTFTFCGLQLVSPRLLRLLPRGGFHTLVDIYESAIRRSMAVVGICVKGSFWADVGTPESYLDAHGRALEAFRLALPGRRLVSPAILRRAERFKRRGVRIHGFAAIGDNVFIRRGARLADSVVWDNVRIGGSADIGRSILADSIHVACHIRGTAVSAADAADATVVSVLNRLGWNKADTLLLPLEARGSDRTFTRLVAGRRSAVLVRYGTERNENKLYARYARFLAGLGIGTPAVLLSMPAARLCVMEDLGHETLLDAAQKGFNARVNRIYGGVMACIAQLHLKGLRAAGNKRIPLNPPFDRWLYRWEHELFEKCLLPLFPDVSPGLVREAMQELGGISRRLNAEPPVLLHRDLQSSNVMIVKNSPVLIDFQGMRRGPAVHDLASLLCDPYVDPPEKLRARLLRRYAALVQRSLPELEIAFRYGAVQRLVQALGAFGRLGAVPATRRFLKHIGPALRGLAGVLADLDNCPRLRELVAILKEVRL